MLVLSRKVDEVIRIGDDIEVMVVDIRGDRVRLGFRAPKNVEIQRQEIAEAREKVHAQQRMAPADG